MDAEGCLSCLLLLLLCPQKFWPEIISSPNSVLWKTGQNFGLKSRLIFWAEIIRPEMQFRPPDVLALRDILSIRDSLSRKPVASK